MELKELEQNAGRGEAMPLGLNQAEQFYFLSLRALYRDYCAKAIDKEHATKEKAELKKTMNDGLIEYGKYRAVYEGHAENTRKAIAESEEALKAILLDGHPYVIALKMAHALSLLLRNGVYYEQCKTDINAICGEVEPLSDESEKLHVQGMIEKLERAAQKQTNDHSKARLLSAAEVHKQRLKNLEEQL